MKIPFRAALASVLLVLAGAVVASATLPRVGVAAPPPTRYGVVYLTASDLSNNRVNDKLRGCTAVSMTSHRELLAVLCGY